MSELKYTHQQKEAINYDGNLVVIACPGSGKTTILKEKIRKITNSLHPHQGIIGITFTVKASQELEVRSKAKGHDTKQSFFCTIDSFCYKELILPFLSRVWNGKPKDCQVVKKLKLPQKSLFFKEYNSPELNDINIDSGFRELYMSGFLWMSSFSALGLLILNNSISAQNYIKARYTHIFIDEYQDSSFAQHQLFLKIIELGLTGIVVGDINQSVYEFRGANSALLKELVNNTIFHSIKVDINHRSHPSIINYASRLLNPNSPLITYTSDDCRVYRTYINGSAINAASHIEKFINLLMQEKVFGIFNLDNFAILAKIEKTLASSLKSPYRLFIDTPLDNIGSQCSDLYSVLLKYKYGKVKTAQEVINLYIANGKLNEKNNTLTMRNLLKDLRDCLDSNDTIRIIQLIADNLNIDYSSIENNATNIILSNDELIKTFTPVANNEIQIMTLHKSKGLEFKVVFHLDLEEWTFPYRQYTGDFNQKIYPNIAQETNLHYVGITRAKELCVLVQCGLRENRNGNLNKSYPSHFLELDCLEGLYQNIQDATRL